MRLKHVRNAILFIVALQHFELKGKQLNFPPEMIVSTGGTFWYRLFFANCNAGNSRGYALNA